MKAIYLFIVAVGRGMFAYVQTTHCLLLIVAELINMIDRVFPNAIEIVPAVHVPIN